ncbi:TetR/AcrR family transcriptional regulator [Klenkia sp. LSe6-5]|uniref:TetR/AcrR family transcriptional regulator n=1 Tax=Klenkia sesuvii TaxID=3103137 RepID=A0ABU8DP72_9ACTN
MPSKERRARQRADVRARIIGAASTVLVGEGIAALTMRRVAHDVEYTPPVIYQHFANKDALVGELVRQGYGELVRQLDAAAQEAPDLDARLTGVAAAYLRFAAENVHLFDAMNSSSLPDGERRAAAEPVIGVVWDLMSTWAQTHRVELDVGAACEIIWGTLLGIATLGRLDTVDGDRARRLGVDALRLLLQGWRAAA